MANILSKYGIKEVADVTIYEINDDGSRGKPVLFLDTLKVSTIEQTASQASARGGKGNPELIVWDFGKEITLTLEDALFSPQSMNMIYGGQEGGKNVDLISKNNLNRMEKVDTTSAGYTYQETDNYYSVEDYTALTYDSTNKKFKISGTNTYYTNKLVYRQKNYAIDGHVIEITAANFPGTYCIVGETYARSETTGKDEYFQFEVPKAKMGAENTLTLEAEGDPTVFNMTMKVLRPEDGVMIRLTQFTVAETTVKFRYQDADNASSYPGSVKVVKGDKVTMPATDDQGTPASAAAPDGVLYRKGYKFKEWTTDQGGTTAIELDGGKYTVAANAADTITLWAQWEALA